MGFEFDYAKNLINKFPVNETDSAAEAGKTNRFSMFALNSNRSRHFSCIAEISQIFFCISEFRLEGNEIFCFAICKVQFGIV